MLQLRVCRWLCAASHFNRIILSNEPLADLPKHHRPMTPLPATGYLLGKVVSFELSTGPERRKPGPASAFSRTDLLFTAAALLVLLFVISKSHAGWREPGKQTLCANNLRQLAASLLMFATENDDLFPKRTLPAWPTALSPFYKDTNVLVCPADTPV